MLTPQSATQVFGEEFSLTITISTSSAGAEGEEPVSTPSTEVPTVTRSFTDSGVTVTPGAGEVTISGKYVEILPTSWQWLDKSGATVTTTSPPKSGEFSQIIKMDAPPSLTQDCIYTIGDETFTHTVTLVSYSKGRDLLLGLLKEVK